MIRARDGRVAAVHAAPRECGGYWLPGGGAHPGEGAEDTLRRELREELGYEIRIGARLGEAIQVFHAADEGRWFEMTATFFFAEFDGAPSSAAEHEVCWLDAARHPDAFFHACHAWAATLA